MSVEESGRYSSIVTLVNSVEETAEEANDPAGVSESREREFSQRGQNKSGKSKGTSRFGEQQQLQALGNQQNQQQQREESCQGTGHGRIDDRGKKQLSRCLCRSAHCLDVCSQFIAMSLRDQLHFVWEKGFVLVVWMGCILQVSVRGHQPVMFEDVLGSIVRYCTSHFREQRRTLVKVEVSLMWGAGGASERFLLCVQLSTV